MHNYIVTYSTADGQEHRVTVRSDSARRAEALASIDHYRESQHHMFGIRVRRAQ